MVPGRAPDHAPIRDYYEGAGRPSRLRIEYAVQPVADGTARAVQSAQAYAAADPFLVLNSDNLYPAPVLRALVELDGPGLPAYARDTLVHDSGFPPDRVAAFAAIEIDRDGYLARIVESRAYTRRRAGPDQHERAGDSITASSMPARWPRRNAASMSSRRVDSFERGVSSAPRGGGR